MGNLYETNEEHFIYLNTNAKDAVFIIEIILVKEENNRAERASAGYAMIPIPDSKDLHNSQMKSIQIESGSPRLLLENVYELNSNKPKSTKLHFEFF